MPRCAHERDWPDDGFAWTPPGWLSSESGVRVETERLVVRSYTLDDAPGVWEAVDASRDHLLPWMEWVHEMKALANQVEYVARQVVGLDKLAKLNELGVGIFDRESGRFMGSTGFHGLQRSTASAETGYWIRSDAVGGGLCAEAMGTWISCLLRPADDGGFGLERVYLYCSARNVPSRRIAEKLGMPFEVVQRADYFVKTVGMTDRLGFGVLREEWDFAAHRAREGLARARHTES